jgi:hypothetical protein
VRLAFFLGFPLFLFFSAFSLLLPSFKLLFPLTFLSSFLHERFHTLVAHLVGPGKHCPLATPVSSSALLGRDPRERDSWETIQFWVLVMLFIILILYMHYERGRASAPKTEWSPVAHRVGL